MARRFRTPQAKSGELLAKYGQEYGDRDIYYCWPENEDGMRADSRLLMSAIERVDIHDGKSLRRLLEERDYDITTLKFSIKKRSSEL